LQKDDDGFGEKFEIHRVFFPVQPNEREIDVPGIMINCTSTGDTPYDRNAQFVDNLMVDLPVGILMFADDYGRSVSPDHKGVGRSIHKKIFLCGDIEIRFVLRSLNTAHHAFGLDLQNYIFSDHAGEGGMELKEKVFLFLPQIYFIEKYDHHRVLSDVSGIDRMFGATADVGNE
jgi:hypothetical protein